MEAYRHIWQSWASTLHRWGMGDWVASVLEAAGPLTIIGAQAVYLSQPLFNLAVPDNHLDALASLLEDSAKTRAFASLLREVPSS
jgi:hypothetical protein